MDSLARDQRRRSFVDRRKTCLRNELNIADELNDEKVYNASCWYELGINKVHQYCPWEQDTYVDMAFEEMNDMVSNAQRHMVLFASRIQCQIEESTDGIPS